MINEYFKEKAINKEYQNLLSWQKFYLEFANEWESIKIDRKIARFELKHFE